MKTYKLAITLGDPGGIGPEIALKAACQHQWPKSLRLVLVGSRTLLREESSRCNLPLPPHWDASSGGSPVATVVNWDPNRAQALISPVKSWQMGRQGASQGKAVISWISAAVRMCQAEIFHGMVTAPISKQSLHLAGSPFAGHTEMLAALTRTRRFAMLLFGHPLRVTLVTRHVPLKSVASTLNRQAIMAAAQLTVEGLTWLGIKNRNLGVCALNPHAGDNGVLGNEEKTIITPALRTLQKRGLAVHGPIPADVIFHQALRGRYGAVLAMYHDQGLAPLKMLAFEKGVNLTLGLPILRTSPDHGTAFDIAGRNRANPSSMIAAIKLAARLAKRQNPWSKKMIPDFATGTGTETC